MFGETFCSSPWFHLRISYDGSFRECRWSERSTSPHNFKDTSVMEYYNSEQMSNLRTKLLSGEKPDICKKCYYEDTFDKLSGRKRQLLKSGVIENHFDLSLRNSPHFDIFKYSAENAGQANYYPVDLQIDLGNTCNSACIMCTPMSSSKLAADYIKLNKITPELFDLPVKYKSWTQDPNLLDRFVKEISEISHLKYVHFIGGETLYDPAFYKICDKLIETGISKEIVIGATTNGTLYDDKIEKIITNFKGFHLGVSIESVTELNDYIRYPSQIVPTLENIKKFLSLRERSNLYVSLRITPNIFTIYELDKLIEFMIRHNVIAESCNILNNPDVLKMELLPNDIRIETIDKIRSVINKYNLSKANIINVRVPSSIVQVLSDVAIDYLTFLESYKVPDNAEELRFRLVKFLKSFESIRGNSIIDYAPRYTEFLRSYGY